MRQSRWAGYGALVRSAGPMAGVQILGAGATFALHVVVARLFGTGFYGFFAHVVAVAGLVALLAPLGWNNAIVRFTANYFSDRAWAHLKGAWVACNRTTLVVSAGSSILLILASRVMKDNEAVSASFLAAAALAPLLAALEVRRRFLQGFMRFSRSLVPEQIILPVAAIGFAGVLAWLELGRHFILFYAAIALGAVLYAQLQVDRAIPEAARPTPPAFLFRSWMSIALPMLGSSIGYLVLNRLDITLLGILVEMDEVGEYAAAKRIVMLGVFVLAALNSVIAPSLAAASHRGDHEEFRRIISRVRRISAALGFPVFVILLVAPEFCLSIFGIRGGEAALVLRILTVGQIINVLTGPVGIAMAMSSMERNQAVICGVTAVLAAAAMPAAVSRWGLIGAASITAGSIAIQNVAMLIALEANAKYRMPGRDE